MNTQTKLTISTEIQKLLSTKTNYQNQLSKKIGVSAAHLINIKDQNKWAQVSEKTWNKLAVFLGLSKQWSVVGTTNFDWTIAACKEAQTNKGIIGVAGVSGYGKTTALKHYAANNPNAFYKLTDYLERTGDFLRSTASVIGVDPTGSPRIVLQNIVNKLNNMKDPLLIWDDAGKLSDNNFKNIQLLYDATEGNAGFIIAGTLSLKQYIDKMTLKGKAGFDELSRRIEYWQILKAPAIEEVKFICDNQGITDEKAVYYIYNTAKNFGTMESLIRRAQKISNEITVEVLETVKVH